MILPALDILSIGQARKAMAFEDGNGMKAEWLHVPRDARVHASASCIRMAGGTRNVSHKGEMIGREERKMKGWAAVGDELVNQKNGGPAQDN
jgi:hypothetical protein